MEYLISDWIVLLFHGVLFSKSQLNFLFDVPVSPSSTLTRDVQSVHHTLNIGTRRQPQPRVLDPSHPRSINPHLAHRNHTAPH